MMAGMGAESATENGYVNARLKSYCEELASGGVGITVVGVGCIDLLGKINRQRICIYRDKSIAGSSKLTQVIHRHDVKVAVQLRVDIAQ